MKLIPAPGMIPSHMVAMETLLEAYVTLDQVIKLDRGIAREHGFLIDKALLKTACPFMWARETTRAVFEASKSIPYDTTFNKWNLDTPSVWWWFEEPIPIQTLEREGDELIGVRALSFGWVDHNNSVALACSSWCDDTSDSPRTLTPSQTWCWNQNDTLQNLLVSAREGYLRLYGPGAIFAHKANIGVEKFMIATEVLSRFVLAGLAWIGQKILVDESGHIERHRRKDLNRRLNSNISDVRIISLRKTIRAKTNEPVTIEESSKVDWAGRWVVGGHFRNQACGLNHSERKLTWVSPYVKGPDDKPFLPSKRKVYKVAR